VEECSGVIYRVDCDSCDASYVGQMGTVEHKNERT